MSIYFATKNKVKITFDYNHYIQVLRARGESGKPRLNEFEHYHKANHPIEHPYIGKVFEGVSTDKYMVCLEVLRTHEAGWITRAMFFDCNGSSALKTIENLSSIIDHNTIHADEFYHSARITDISIEEFAQDSNDFSWYERIEEQYAPSLKHFSYLSDIEG